MHLIFSLLMSIVCVASDGPPERNFGKWSPSSDDEPFEEEAIVGGPEDDPDGDGHTNAEEQDAGTNPNYEYSHPYTGDYRVGYCSKRPDPTGPTKAQTYSDGDGFSYDYWSYQQGDVAENFTMVDQHGEAVDLYSFCGTHVMLVVASGWCVPCQLEAAELQNIADQYPTAQILQIVSQDADYNTPSPTYISQWANAFGFENVAALGPLASPTSYDEIFAAPDLQFEDDGLIPTIYHLNEELKVVSADQGISTPDTWL